MAETKNTILIAEDEEAMLHALSEKFKKAGFEVIQAHDGEEALNIGTKNTPDIMVIDLIMPKMDGLTLAKNVREDKKWGANVPIIILTNLSDPESVAEAAKFCVYDFLVKTDWRLDDVVQLAKGKLESKIN